MKRYSSGLYARLGFSVAIHSNPDIVLVDEVLAVGDAAFRRRALEALRQLIADGKTVLFISHDMWNVRRLCDQILWMEEGRVRAYGAGGRDRRALHERGERAGARQPGDRAAEPSRRHRRDPLHSRRPARRRGRAGRRCSRRATTLVVRAAYRAEQRGRAAGLPGRHRRRRHRARHHDRHVATGRRAGDGRRRRRRSSAGSRGCRCGRGSTSCGCRSPTATSSRRTTWSPPARGSRSAATARGVEGLADEEDGLVSLPFEFAHHAADVARLHHA